MTDPRPLRAYRETLPPEAEHWLATGEVSAWNWLSRIPPHKVWRMHKDRIVRQHIERKPGTRPRLWWRHEAREMRKRLGGTGVTMSDYYPAYHATFEFGIPEFWVEESVQVNDPPVFESEAAYLERLNLWAPGEKAGVRTADWQPVYIKIRGEKVEVYRCARTDG